MQMYFSKSTNGFYIDQIHGDCIPADKIEITVQQHREFLDGQTAGKVISTDEHGNPVLIDPPASDEDGAQ